MNINRPEAVTFLQAADFKGLFRELLFWDRADDARALTHDGRKFVMEAFAQKAGVTAYACRVEDVSQLDYRTRQQIERAAAATFPSHLFVFFDGEWMTWQWSRREANQPRQLRSVGPFHKSSSFEPILQKLDVLAYDIENGNVQAADVDKSLKEAFNVEPVTKTFYKQFEAQYKDFLASVGGIAEEYEREFASLMLNRLMFLYFMQSKGFLLHDKNYLRNRFDDKAARVRGKSDYLHGFLAPLFFQILSVRRDDRGGGKIEVAREYSRVFGDLIYLNGGLFSQRDWEKNAKISIPDAAFEKVFDFFGNWQWQLDERPTRDNREINPDVLGYVFEKFINQRQMGAYYTKEDITGYISSRTILPFLFEKSGLDAKRPFELLQSNIERYIFPAVKHGCELELPPEIAVGIEDVAQRGGWNKSAPSEYALPTEIWREVVARRARFENLTSASTRASLVSVSDLITHNLDISQWMIDVIADISEPRELENLWDALQSVSILDPTVGSGAFLFAAMGVLQPISSACLERMDGFVGEAEARAQKQAFQSAPAFENFEKILREIEEHPNRNYAIFKKLAVQNLYGVDIMPEATEICKLRLFLKLASQVAPDDKAKNMGIEPLPDIDFNIRAGNTLVGFTTLEEVKTASQTQINFGATWQEIEAEMRAYGAALDNFRRAQLEGGSITQAVKETLTQQHDALVEKLNLFNAGVYSQAPKSQPAEYAAWKASHQPFHWCAEFYSVVKNGGFDVIIGNPPYVEYAKVRGDYTIKGYETESCGNLYAFVMERVRSFLSANGANGFIVPHSVICTDRMEILQRYLQEESMCCWTSSYDTRPAKLFVGVDQRLLIYVLSHIKGKRVHYSSRYYRWNEEARANLLSMTEYVEARSLPTLNSIPKIYTEIETGIWNKVSSNSALSYHIQKSGNSFFFHNAPRYWIRAMDFEPHFFNARGDTQSSQLKTVKVQQHHLLPIVASLNSTLFYWWFILLSDCRHLNLREIESFPFSIDKMKDKHLLALKKCAVELMKDLKTNSVRKDCFYQATGQVVYDEFYPKKSKPIIDEIDRVLAQHYGFTDEELDFILNYDVKYRMGREAGEE